MNIGWRNCRKCGKRGYLQNECSECLDKMSKKLYKGKPKPRNKCFIHWCDFHARESGYCAHHEDNQDDTELFNELTIPEACEHYGVSKSTIYEWCNAGREGTRNTRYGWAVTPLPWMEEYVDCMKNWEEA